MCDNVLCNLVSGARVEQAPGGAPEERDRPCSSQGIYAVYKPLLWLLSCALPPQDSLHRQAVDRSQQMEREVSEARREVEELRQERLEWQQQQV